jgi:hypothetical protein
MISTSVGKLLPETPAAPVCTVASEFAQRDLGVVGVFSAIPDSLPDAASPEGLIPVDQAALRSLYPF